MPPARLQNEAQVANAGRSHHHPKRHDRLVRQSGSAPSRGSPNAGWVVGSPRRVRVGALLGAALRQPLCLLQKRRRDRASAGDVGAENESHETDQRR